MKRWIIYTDGSAADNANIDKSKVYCGYAWAIEPKKNAEGHWINKDGEEINAPETFFADEYDKPDGTNNKMELLAILDFLSKANKRGYYTIRTDSAYAITSMQQREQREASRIGDQLYLPSGKPAINSDLLIGIFEQMARLEANGARIEFEKVKGHGSDPMNNFVDQKAQNRAYMLKLKKTR